jgi:hypothetical protein
MKPILIFVLIVLIQACEYEPPEKITYVNPDYSAPALTIVTLDLNSDYIFVCGSTRISFELASSDQEITAVVVDCLGKTTNINSRSGFFDVDPTGYPDGDYKIKMDVYTHSGTGSLADKVGAEGYLFTREWTLKVERPASISLKFLPTTVENGFLKIQWQRFNRPYFHFYKIVMNDSSLGVSSTKIIYDVNTTSILDSSFVGGKADFTLKIGLNECSGTSPEYTSDKLIYRYPVSITYNEKADSTTVNWTNIPFKHTIYLSSNSTRTYLGYVKSYTMRSPGLGNEIRYTLSVKPSVKLTYDHQMYYIYSNYTLGTKTALSYNKIVYVPGLNSFFLKGPSFLRKYDGTTLAKLQSYDYSYDYYDNVTIGVSPDNSTVFTTANHYITKLKSSTLQNINTKKFASGAYDSKYFYGMYVLNDSMMYVAYGTSVSLYNNKTGTIISTCTNPYAEGAPYNISVSKDNQYLAICGSTWFKIYRNPDNLHLDLVYQVTGTFIQCIFDPVNTYNLLLITPDKATVVHCPDMGLLYTIPATVKGYAVNFDPVTNYLLFVSSLSKTVTVYDYEHDVIKFKCMHHDSFPAFYLANNTIYHNSGYSLNTNYVFHAK